MICRISYKDFYKFYYVRIKYSLHRVRERVVFDLGLIYDVFSVYKIFSTDIWEWLMVFSPAHQALHSDQVRETQSEKYLLLVILECWHIIILL